MWLIARIAIALIIVNGSGLSPLYAQEQIPQVPEQVPEQNEQATVSSHLSEALRESGGAVPILILLKDQPDLALLEMAAISASTSDTPTGTSAERRVARATYLYKALTAHAQSSQADLRAWLDDAGLPYRAFYIVNMILVNGDATLVEALRQHPDVARLDADPLVDALHELATPALSWAQILALPEAANLPDVPDSLDTPYGVNATRAPEVWALGYRGQGITIASQDTGVEWDHPALIARYRGAQDETVDHIYNWLNAIPADSGFDACEELDAPCDDNGHGTHTVGTMIGASDVMTYGVAPDALWMGCRNMRGGVGTPDTYTACFEFFLAPYPPGGDPFTDGRPEFAPHIVNNSWGCPSTEGCNVDSLRQVVETVRAAGIMVVASVGNNGVSGCSTVIDPIAIYDETFSVGAHDANGSLASFSSRGPVLADGSNRLKPDLTAPGVGILSTWRFGRYSTLSGTSMASPHVAGAVALLWSAAPWLIGEIDLTEQILLKSAAVVEDSRCSGASEATSPNPAFGYGRLDVAAAVEMAQPWQISVSVSNTAGSPVIGAEVAWIDARTGYTYASTTDEKGNAVVTTMLRGNYTLEVQNGPTIVSVAGIELSEDEVTGSTVADNLTFAYAAKAVVAPVTHPTEQHYYLPLLMTHTQ
jgi:serine protease AprX